ncbi:MAG: peptidoglycan-binding domain-containing protein [Bacteroidota bacterium]
MRTLKLSDTGKAVILLQKLLAKVGFTLPSNGNFDQLTLQFVRDFQSKENLVVDGVVGSNTWKILFAKGYDFKLGAKSFPLNKDEYFPVYQPKDTIYLHHTAGRGRPDFTIGWWEKDNQPGKLLRVATAFVIGREALNGNKDFDGVTCRAFPEYAWAHHLGLNNTHAGRTRDQNRVLNQKSIGIEICSLGGLQKRDNGTFFFKGKASNIEVPKEQVCELDQPWRGFTYFHKYTDTQIEECKRLILLLSFIFEIDLPNRIYRRDWFDLKYDALTGVPGLWTHCNVRYDKTDCFPQPEFIDMLNTLHEAAKTFVPSVDALERFEEVGVDKIEFEDAMIQNYTEDLDDAGIEE